MLPITFCLLLALVPPPAQPHTLATLQRLRRGATKGASKDKITSDEEQPEEKGGGEDSFKKPSWTLGTKKETCSKECKPPPPDAICSPVNVYDKSIPRASGPSATCCPTLKCYNKDGSFFPFHGNSNSEDVQNRYLFFCFA